MRRLLGLCGLLSLAVLGGAVATAGEGPRAVGALQASGFPTSEASRKIAARLRALSAEVRARGLAAGATAPRDAASRFSSTTLRLDDVGHVQVYVALTETTEDTLDTLRRHGLAIELVNHEFDLVQGWIRVEALEALAAELAVLQIRPPGYGQPRAGAIETLGAALHRCDAVRGAGFTGAGVTVGVVSNGVDGLAASRALGELPPVQVLGAGFGDEGTALLEIIHDCAPGAALAFAAGGDTSLAFIAAVNVLRDAGARIIVDDLGFTDETFFEDGLAALNDRTVGATVLRVSAAGNDARNHYQGMFLPSVVFDPEISGTRHDFGGADTLLRIRIPALRTATLILQWGNPVGGAADDYDLCARATDGTLIACALVSQDGDDDPIETLDVACQSGTPCLVDLQITRFSGLPQLLELYCFNRSCEFLEHGVVEDSVFGHPAVPEVLAVGAAPAGHPLAIEPFSAGGPSTILFPAPEIRMKPDLTGIDGVATSRPGFNPFVGTSAAAPHVAAVAALVLQGNPALAPAALRSLLRTTALDLGPAGFDPSFGFGGADAQSAVAAATGMPVSARLTLQLNQATFGPGQTMRLAATLTPGLAPTGPVDAYVVVRLPDGSLLSLLLDGSVVPGLEPLVRGFAPFPFSGELFVYTVTGGEPPGAYAWLGALTQTGTLAVLDSIDGDSFTLTP